MTDQSELCIPQSYVITKESNIRHILFFYSNTSQSGLFLFSHSQQSTFPSIFSPIWSGVNFLPEDKPSPSNATTNQVRCRLTHSSSKTHKAGQPHRLQIAVASLGFEQSPDYRVKTFLLRHSGAPNNFIYHLLNDETYCSTFFCPFLTTFNVVEHANWFLLALFFPLFLILLKKKNAPCHIPENGLKSYPKAKKTP